MKTVIEMARKANLIFPGVDQVDGSIEQLERFDELVRADERARMAEQPAGSVYRYGKDSSGTPWHGILWTASGLDLPDGTLIYTSPPAQRKPLTDEELYKVFPAIASYTEANKTLYRSIARAIEAAYGIKGDA